MSGRKVAGVDSPRTVGAKSAEYEISQRKTTIKNLHKELEQAQKVIVQLQSEKNALNERLRKAQKTIDRNERILTDRARLQGSLDDLLRNEEREERERRDESSRLTQTFVFNLFGPDSPMRTSPRDVPSPEKRGRSDEDDAADDSGGAKGVGGTKRRLVFQ